MLNSVILKIQQIPKLFLGFMVIVIVLIGLYYNDPPQGVCDTQMQSIEERLGKGFYSDTTNGLYGRSVKSAKNFCLSSNSPGGCLDLFNRLNFFEKQIRTLPAECSDHPKAVKMQSIIQKSLKLMAAIGWGDQAPKDRFNKTNWLDTSDLGLFCRLKREHLRLYGKKKWKNFTWLVIESLPESQTLERRQRYERSLFSYPCNGMY